MTANIKELLQFYHPESLLNSLVRMGNWDVDEAADAIRATGVNLTPERVRELEKIWGMEPRRAIPRTAGAPRDLVWKTAGDEVYTRLPV